MCTRTANSGDKKKRNGELTNDWSGDPMVRYLMLTEVITQTHLCYRDGMWKAQNYAVGWQLSESQS